VKWKDVNAPKGNEIMSSQSHPDGRVNVNKLGEFAPLLRADDWRSPLIRRLLGENTYKDSESKVSDSFRNRDLQESEKSLLLKWESLEHDFDRCINTYQEPIITEFAALGLSCILVRHRADLEITEVTRRGEKADYWLGEKELLLEVSGQIDGCLNSLRETKAGQLLANPFNQSGYVCVVNFSSGKAFLWFYQHGEIRK